MIMHGMVCFLGCIVTILCRENLYSSGYRTILASLSDIRERNFVWRALVGGWGHYIVDSRGITRSTHKINMP